MNDILQDYLHYLRIQRGLVENTIISYKQDLVAFSEFLTEQKITSWDKVDR